MQIPPLALTCFLLLLLISGLASVGGRTASDISELSDVVPIAADSDTDPLVPPIIIGQSDTSSDPRAHFHPHGDQVCASGCAVSNHPTDTLSPEHFKRLMAQFAVDATNDLQASKKRAALDTLLYFGVQTSSMLERFPNFIGGQNLTELQRHLKTTHARISIRVVDEYGATRSWIPPTRVPFDRRHVFEMETAELQPHVASGTVKRVGIDRLWTRL